MLDPGSKAQVPFNSLEWEANTLDPPVSSYPKGEKHGIWYFHFSFIPKTSFFKGQVSKQDPPTPSL